jgi:hypothetical protein
MFGMPTRRWAVVTGGIATVCAALAGAGSTQALTVSVRGNDLVGGHGQAIRLLGVDRSGTEYACSEGWGIFDSPHPQRPDGRRMIRAMRRWRVNAVRVPLNEACWLGINGAPARYAKRNYRRAIRAYVHRLERAGIHPILDLHVVDPRQVPAGADVNGLRPMPDAGHALPFWRSVAHRYRHDRAVLFDIYNEPNDIGWRCLLHGCRITHDFYNSSIPHYRAVGTQRLVNAIRRKGARNVIMVPGVEWSNDISKWRRWRPRDPLHRIAASFHNYEGNLGSCHRRCWRRTVAPVERRFPVITDEMGDTDCNHDYIDDYMRWADRHHISYLGWTWDATAPGSWTCRGGPSLITRYDGTPTRYGVGLRDHLRAIRRAPGLR